MSGFQGLHNPERHEAFTVGGANPCFSCGMWLCRADDPCRCCLAAEVERLTEALAERDRRICDACNGTGQWVDYPAVSCPKCHSRTRCSRSSETPMSVCYCGRVEIPLGMTMCNDAKNHVTHGVTACVGAGMDWGMERRAEAAEAEVERLTESLADRDRRIARALAECDESPFLPFVSAAYVRRALRGESDE